MNSTEVSYRLVPNRACTGLYGDEKEEPITDSTVTGSVVYKHV